MVKSLKSSRREVRVWSTSTLLVAICALLISCGQQEPLYKKTFSLEEKLALSESLLNGRGSGGYYQGSPAYEFQIKEAEKVYPQNGDIYREYGAALVKRGFAAKWHETYAKAVALDPEGWQGWRGYLYLYFYRDYERAIHDFNTIDSLTPNFVDYPQSQSVHFMRGICYLQLGNYEKAIEYFDMHIAHETKEAGIDFIEAKAFLYKAIAHWKSGDMQKAKETLDLGVSVDDKNADLYFWLAKYHREMGEDAKAKGYIEQAKKQFLAGYYNHRPYVEEFYQTYWTDLEGW